MPRTESDRVVGAANNDEEARIADQDGAPSDDDPNHDDGPAHGEACFTSEQQSEHENSDQEVHGPLPSPFTR